MRKSGSIINRTRSISDRFRSQIDFSGLVDFLRRAHPHKTAEGIEAHCGIPATTAKKWLLKETRPNGGDLLVLTLAYGPQVVASCVKGAPKWLDHAVREEYSARIKASIAAHEREIEKLLNS